jgi:hypothetical protein
MKMLKGNWIGKNSKGKRKGRIQWKKEVCET